MNLRRKPAMTDDEWYDLQARVTNAAGLAARNAVDNLRAKNAGRHGAVYLTDIKVNVTLDAEVTA